MIFLQPEALLGAAVIALPVGLYLVRKRRARAQLWAASPVLRKALQRLPARNGKGERNLLLLRCLIILLLAVAFARPVVNFTGTITRVANGEVKAVVVLDNSGSMMFRKGATSSFEEAREVVSKLLRKMDPGSVCALYVASGTSVVPLNFEPDALALRKKLQLSQPGEGAGDLYPGIRAAFEFLARQNESTGEIFVVTDNQNQAWKRLGEIQGLLEKYPDILLQVVAVGEHPENNLAVTDLKLDGNVPAAGQSVGCHATVENFGKEAAENIAVVLRADRLPPSDQVFIPKIEPGKSITVQLFATLPAAGPHSLTVSIPPDGLAYDNERSLAVETMKQVQVLIVEGTNVPITMDRDGYFLNQALVPVSREERKDYYLQVNTISSAELDRTPLKSYKMVILSNVAKLSQASALALSAFVDEGGGLAVFPGPSSDLSYYNTDRIFSALLPAKLGTPQNAPGEKKFVSLQKGSFNHPMMASWRKQSEDSLAGVHYTSYFPLILPEGADKSDVSVVLSFLDGSPAIVEKEKGEGSVVLFNSTATPRWNNFPLHPAFVPLIQSLAGYLSKQGSGGLVLTMGQAFIRNFSPELSETDFKVQGPHKLYLGRIERNGNAAVLKFDRTEATGVYSIYMGNSTAPDFVFAVQGDPRESDLKKMPQRELDRLKRPSGDQVGADIFVYQKTGHELWMELGLFVLGLSLIEVGLAHRLNRGARVT